MEAHSAPGLDNQSRHPLAAKHASQGLLPRTGMGGLQKFNHCSAKADARSEADVQRRLIPRKLLPALAGILICLRVSA